MQLLYYLGIYAKTGIPTFYGPALVPSFGEFEPFVDCTYKYFSETLLHDHSLPYHIKQPLFWSDEFINWEEKTKEKRTDQTIGFVIDGIGRIIGGNLNTIQGILGSPYMPHIQEGDILFIEDSSKDGYY